MSHSQDNTLAIVSIIIGGFSLLFSLIPCIGTLGAVPAVISMILGFLAYTKARDAGDSKTLSIVGMVISGLAIAVALMWYLTIANMEKIISYDIQTKEYTDCTALWADISKIESDIRSIEQEFDKAEKTRDISVLGKLSSITTMAMQVEQMKKMSTALGCVKNEEPLIQIDSLTTEN